MLMDPSGRTQICGRYHVCEYHAGQEETLVEWTEVYSASIGSDQFAQAREARGGAHLRRQG